MLCRLRWLPLNRLKIVMRNWRWGEMKFQLRKWKAMATGQQRLITVEDSGGGALEVNGSASLTSTRFPNLWWWFRIRHKRISHGTTFETPNRPSSDNLFLSQEQIAFAGNDAEDYLKWRMADTCFTYRMVYSHFFYSRSLFFFKINK